LLINTDPNLEFEPIRLGKKIELRYIPFSELAIRSNVVRETAASNKNSDEIVQSRFHLKRNNDTKHNKLSKVLKDTDLHDLKRSIAQFGLLKPLEVARMQERIEFFYGKGRYLVIDGQRRYFAIRELLNLPTEDDEKKQRDALITSFQNDFISKAEEQAKQQFERLSIRHFVMIPCLVYPYTTFLQMIRHSIEDKRFGEKPPKDDLEIAEKMCEEGISDLAFDDLKDLWKMRNLIEQEKESIERTLQEIKNRRMAMQNEPSTSNTGEH
jgi:uncharacterized protein YutE (UPF0331/DUF86 family)